MVTNHVHAVIVAGVGGTRPWGVVTDRDVLAAATDARWVDDHQVRHVVAPHELGSRLEPLAGRHRDEFPGRT